MAHPIEQKEEVLRLRKKGESIRDLAKMTELPKSTVSYWCRNVALTPDQIHRLDRKGKRAAAAKCLELGEEKRAERLERTKRYVQKGAQDIGSLSKRDIFVLGLGLYWGEGYKRGSDELGFTNSDQEIIKVYLAWLEKIHGVKKEDLTLRLSINEMHKHREEEVLHYWSIVTRVPLSQFTKTSFIKMRVKKVYPNMEKHFGTLRIKVRRSATLRHRTMGALREIATILENQMGN